MAITPAASSEARGAFVGIGLEHNPADMARAVLEGVVFALRHISVAFQQLGTAASSIKLTGGGGKNRFWRHVLADNLFAPIEYEAGDAALGAAIIAAVGTHLYGSIETAVEGMVSSTAKTTWPDLRKSSLYHVAYSNYVHFRDRLMPIQTSEVDTSLD